MKRSKFSEAQIAFILRQAEEGTAVAEVCRKSGISEATFYAWRKKYAGLLSTEMRRLKALEDENARPKKLVAEVSHGRPSGGASGPSSTERAASRSAGRRQSSADRPL